MREFLMGDIHGARNALQQCLERSGFDYKKDRLIQLGDVADRNADVFECVEELLKIKHLVALRGNHDDWFDEFCQTGHHPVHWRYGGEATAQSYWRHANPKAALPPEDREWTSHLNPSHIPASHRRFFAGLPLYHIDEQERCFVHAGFNRFLPFTGQAPSSYFWDRELWMAALEWHVNERLHLGQLPFQIKTKFREIFLGHTPTTGWNIHVPMRGANVYNLDTGAGQGGRLTIMDLETKKFWQSEPVASLYDKSPAHDCHGIIQKIQ
jgi:serine/threonine protein phosphatase 1